MQEETELQARILKYLQRNAHAAETAEGVNTVWLGRALTEGKVLEVERILDALVDAGVLEKYQLPGGSTVFRRARPEGAD